MASAFFWSLASGLASLACGLVSAFFWSLASGLASLACGLVSAFFWSLASGFFSWAWVGAVTRASNAPVISRAACRPGHPAAIKVTSHGALAPGIMSADRPACGIRVIDVRVRWKVRLSHAAIGRAARLRGGCSFLFE